MRIPVPQLLISAGELLAGTIRRAYTLIPAALLDPFDVAERLFDVTYQVPNYIIWTAVSIGAFVSVTLAYHDLRMSNRRLVRRVNTKTEIARVIDRLAEISGELSDFSVTMISNYEAAQKHVLQLYIDAIELMRGSRILGEGYVARYYRVAQSDEYDDTPDGLRKQVQAEADCLNEFIRELSHRM